MRNMLVCRFDSNGRWLRPGPVDKELRRMAEDQLLQGALQIMIPLCKSADGNMEMALWQWADYDETDGFHFHHDLLFYHPEDRKRVAKHLCLDLQEVSLQVAV